MTDALPTPDRRNMSPRVVVLGVALYCALAWVVLFKAVDLGVGLVRGAAPAVHYAKVDTARD
jgi:hypothetical protein